MLSLIFMWFRARVGAAFLWSHLCSQCSPVLRTMLGKEAEPGTLGGERRVIWLFVSDSGLPDSHKEGVFQDMWENREDLWGICQKSLWNNFSMVKRFNICFCIDNYRCFQSPDFEILFILPTWREYARRNVDIEPQDHEKRINMYLYTHTYI